MQFNYRVAPLLAIILVLLIAPDASAAGNRGSAAGLPAHEVTAETFFVTTTADNGVDANPIAGSLREAINNANENEGLDTIAFAIPGTGVQTITPPARLPLITDDVLIDGTTQGKFKIQISGAALGANNGLHLSGGSSTIRGLVINDFDGAAIWIEGGSSNNVIVGNRLGTNRGGKGALGNGVGVYIQDSSNNRVGGTTGTAPNVCKGDCNLLSGNTLHGVVVVGAGATGNVLLGNFIGTNLKGKLALPNAENGILIANAPANTVGGTDPLARNLVSGNGVLGIEVMLAGSLNTIIQGNYIGTNAAGTLAIPNGDGPGVLVGGGARATIGGAAPGAGNFISGNLGEGIHIQASSPENVIAGNRVGVMADGINLLGNGGAGIFILSSGNTITSNVAAANGVQGIQIKKGTGNEVRFNRVFGNAKLGINLGKASITKNDVGDGDGGANNLQNYPVLASATLNGSTLNIQGTLNSIANKMYALDFFQSPACHPRGVGEGKTYLGSANVTTNSSGNAEFVEQLSGGVAGGVVTATATDPNGNTSEFSYCVAVQ
jgi:parallel beta-helix repeat protein